MFHSNFILLFLLSISLPHLVSSKTGFSIDLIHLDSPKSPFQNHNLTLHDRSRLSFHRSIARALNIQSRVTPSAGEYLMSINIGTPPMNIMVMADTASQLLWTQCKPCQSCYEQNAPIYDSYRSSTYKTISAKSKSCSDLGSWKSKDKEKCSYQYTYDDPKSSTTAGALSTETFSFDSSDAKNKKVSLPNMKFGCSNYTRGNFMPEWAGIVGLNRGPLSLISQLGSSINYKFSYCLVPTTKEVAGKASSLMNFGDEANVGAHASVTPIIRNKGRFFPKKKGDSYYWLKLESISVGNEKVAVANKKKYKKGQGNIMIDSGASLTILDDDMLQPLVDKVSTVVKYPRIRKRGVVYKPCYNVSGFGSGRKRNFPDITFQFTSAAVTLKPLNTFLEVEKDVMCFAFISSVIIGGVQIWGNIAQQNMHIGFDLNNNKLSITHADCSKM